MKEKKKLNAGSIWKRTTKQYYSLFYISIHFVAGIRNVMFMAAPPLLQLLERISVMNNTNLTQPERTPAKMTAQAATPSGQKGYINITRYSGWRYGFN